MAETETKVSCALCGKYYKAITNTHLWRKHSIDMEEYKSRFPNYPIESPLTKKINNKHRKKIANSEKGLLIRSKNGKSNKGKKRSQEWRQKRSEKYTGKGNPFYNRSHTLEARKKLSRHFQSLSEEEWTGFTKDEKVRAWKSKRAKRWSKEIFELDGFRCVLCGSNKQLEAHHIVTRGRAPDRIYDNSNGITLCRPCHQTTFGKETLFEDRFRKMVKKRISHREKPVRC